MSHVSHRVRTHHGTPALVCPPVDPFRGPLGHMAAPTGTQRRSEESGTHTMRRWEPIHYHPSPEVEAVGAKIDRLADERPPGWEDAIWECYKEIEAIEEREREE